MNKTFTLGALTGVAALALAVPVAVQLTSAATGSSSSIADVVFQRPPSSQEDIQAMIDRDEAVLANIDSMVTVFKSATQAHLASLNAAVSLTDDAARQAAVKTANTEFRTTIQTAVEANPALKDALPFGGKMLGHGFRHRGPAPEMLAEKLGMTPEELKAAVESGKTIEQLAEEKGVELPRLETFKIRLDGFLEEKLGMTAEELKTELESGKTIEQIAEEKGVELPAPPMFRGMRMMDPADQQ